MTPFISTIPQSGNLGDVHPVEFPEGNSIQQGELSLLIHVPVAIFYRNHHSCFYRLAFLMILEGQGHPGAVNNNPSVPDFHV